MKKAYYILGISLTLLACKKECQEWHEADGRDCVEMREKFIGNFNGTLQIAGLPPDSATFTISASSLEVNYLYMDNFGGYAELTSATQFTYPEQPIPAQAAIPGTYYGSGSIYGKTLQFHYTQTDTSGSSINAVFTGVRQ